MRTSRTSKIGSLSALLTVALVVIAGSQRSAGQQSVPFQGGVPVAPLGLSGKPLPALPVVLDTAEGMRVRVSAVARGLENPWSIAFLPDGTILVTERMGRLRAIRNGVLDPQPVAGTPRRSAPACRGCRAPCTATWTWCCTRASPRTGCVYLSYTKPLDEKRRTAAVARGRWDGKGIADMKDIFVLDEGTGGAVRLAFGRDASLYLTTTGATPQDPEHASRARCCASRTTARSRWTTRSWASRITSPRCSRSAIAARSGWR